MSPAPTTWVEITDTDSLYGRGYYGMGYYGTAFSTLWTDVNNRKDWNAPGNWLTALGNWISGIELNSYTPVGTPASVWTVL